jgi:putative hydrolase of the HAD superfamily
VANYLSNLTDNPAKEIYFQLTQVLHEKGRGKVFDTVLHELNCFSKKEVKKCLSVYRNHEPDIKPDNAAVHCLKKFRNYPKYVVTDGNKWVQLRKIRALGIEPYFKKIFRTYQYGVKYSKPSTFCFHKICSLEEVSTNQVLYIADNPHKDFINLKKEGFLTLRVRQGFFKNVTLDDEHEAHYQIKSLEELTEDFLFRKLHYNQ